MSEFPATEMVTDEVTQMLVSVDSRTHDEIP